MGYTQHKGTKGIKHQPNDFDEIKNYLQKVDNIVTTDEIPDNMVINWDQAACNLVPGGNWTCGRKEKNKCQLMGWMTSDRILSYSVSPRLALSPTAG